MPHIGVSKVCYLGHIFDYNGMHPDPCKVSCIQDWPTPTNAITLKQFQQFLGLASYYQRCIKKFADIAAPLHNLTKKDVSFSWSPECTKAFVELKSNAKTTAHLDNSICSSSSFLITKWNGISRPNPLGKIIMHFPWISNGGVNKWCSNRRWQFGSLANFTFLTILLHITSHSRPISFFF